MHRRTFLTLAAGAGVISVQSLAADDCRNQVANPEPPVAAPQGSGHKISVIGMGSYGARSVFRIAGKMPPAAGDATLKFIGIDGANRMRRRLLPGGSGESCGEGPSTGCLVTPRVPNTDSVILVGSIGRGEGMELSQIAAGQARQKFDAKGSPLFVMAVVALPFSRKQSDLDVTGELDRLKRYADMVCTVSHDEWAARLGKQYPSKAEVMTRCEREVDRCVEAVIHGLQYEKQLVSWDIDVVRGISDGVGHVTYGQGRVQADGDCGLESVQTAIRQCGMERFIASAEHVLAFLAGPRSMTGRSVITVMKELHRHIKADAMISIGIRYDSAIPPGTLQFDLWVDAANTPIV